MHSASYRYSSNLSRGSRWRRAIALFLAVLVHALLIIMLLRQAPPPSRLLEPQPRPVTFQLSPEPQSTSKRASAAPKAETAHKAPPRPPEPLPPAPPVAPPIPPLPFLTLSKEEFAAADIAKLPSHRGEQTGGDISGDTGKNSGSAYGPGEGPGGERLYEADWYRKPTNAELSFYMPANAPSTGWGLIACQTVEHYRVDNCRTLGESPLGSGLARAVRQAAWQFLVRPPRIGGRPVIGAWVRIRIDYTEGVPQ